MIGNNEKLISVTKLYMIFVGMWRFEESNTNKFLVKCYNKYYATFVYILYILFMSMLSMNMIVLLRDGDPRKQMAATLSVLVAVIDIVIKLSIFKKYKIEKLFRIVKLMESDVWNSGNRDIIAFYKKQVVYCRSTCILLAGVTIVTSLAFASASFQSIIQSSDAIEDFMYHIWLPFDKKKHVMIVILLNSCLLSYSCIMVPTIKQALCSLMIFCSTHLQILQYKVRNRKFNGDSTTAIKGYIHEHRFLIWFIETFDKSTSFVMLLEFLFNALNLAAIILDLLTTDAMMFPAFYAILATIQIFILAWNADQIRYQSLAVGDAFYESIWHLEDVDTQKLLILIILRTHKPLMLHLGPFGPMTAETAVNTMKVAYSCVTLLTKQYKRKQYLQAP